MPNFLKLIIVFVLVMTCSCRRQNRNIMHEDFRENGEARNAFQRLFGRGDRVPTGEEVTRELSDPSSGMNAQCATTRPERTELTTGEYDIQTETVRLDLVQQIIDAGPDNMTSTTMEIGGRCYEVLNDHVTLADGTYLPLTCPDAERIANAWGYVMPTESQLVEIGRYARQNGFQVPAIPISPNNREDRYDNMNEMMNNSVMRARAETGRTRMIDGHFKWYTNDCRIYGFAKRDGSFYQRTASPAHSRDEGYYDYSHGVRLMRPCGSQL